MYKYKSYRYRIYPNLEQVKFFEKNFRCVKFIYNKMLDDKLKHYKEKGKNLKLTPAMYKNEYPFLKEVDCLALSNAQLNLEKAYTHFFKNPSNNGFPKFKTKYDKNSYTTNNQSESIRIVGNFIRLPKINFVRIKLHRPIPDGYKIKSTTITRTKSNKYFITIFLEYDKQDISIKNKHGEVVGLDFSTSKLFVASDGHSPDLLNLSKLEKRIAKEQKSLSKMVKWSNNYNKQVLKIAKIYERLDNIKKDYLHKLSTKMANTYSVIGIESLDLTEMSSSDREIKLGKSIRRLNWGEFTRELNYKMNDLGKSLIKVNKFFPSSQLCSVCNYRNKELKNLSIREWFCPKCNSYHNRDINAAINIRNEAIRLNQNNIEESK